MLSTNSIIFGDVIRYCEESERGKSPVARRPERVCYWRTLGLDELEIDGFFRIIELVFIGRLERPFEEVCEPSHHATCTMHSKAYSITRKTAAVFSWLLT